MGDIQPDDKLTFFRKPKPPDPRVVERWARRLEALSTSDGYVLHTTLALTNTKIFYVPEVRESVKGFLAGFSPLSSSNLRETSKNRGTSSHTRTFSSLPSQRCAPFWWP
jgi:hypothetical protein